MKSLLETGEALGVWSQALGTLGMVDKGYFLA